MANRSLLALSVAAFLAASGVAAAENQENESGPLAGHSSHGEAFNEGPRQAAHPIEGTGQVHFPITTGEPLAQQFFTQGLGQLHGFWYFEAERSFRQAAAVDPGCAMAYWGAAMANLGNEKRARGWIAEAVQRKAEISRRERLYIEALDAYLKTDRGKKKERAQAYTRALEGILYEFPEDVEAKALLALQLWNNRSHDLPIVSHLAVDALLDQVFEAQPLHPAHHYRIHLWDYERPEKALGSAALCGPAAPAIAHMWHMPGHIYSRLKRYEDAVWQQEASARVDHAHMMRDRVLPDQIHNFAHNNEWLIRNLNHIGRVGDAVELAKNMCELPRHPKYNTLSKRGSAFYGRQRLFETLRRFELWEEMITLCHGSYLEPTEDEPQQVKRLRHLGVAYFRSGDVENGQGQLALLQQRLQDTRDAQQQAVETAESKLEGEENQEQAEIEKAREKAREKAQKPFENQIRELEKAIQELEGLQAVAAGDYAAALERLKEAGGVDPLYLALVQLQAGETEAALEAARKHVDSHQHQVQPLACLVDLLWRAEQREEAAEAFQRLREISASIDLQSPVFARLEPIARELDWCADWRLPPTPAADVGVRPELDTLGPFRWSPSAAPAWTLKDSEGRDQTLEQFSGRPVILIFYLGHACLHCAEQLQAFAPLAEQFQQAGIELIAISTDHQQDLQLSLDNYAESPLPIPLVANSELDVFQAYRVYDDFEQQPLHGTFLIDGAGQVRWQDISFEPFMDPKFLLEEAQRLLEVSP